MKTLILAGGSGTRLWPMSRKYYPKQFLKIGGKDSFLRQTVKMMLQMHAPENLYILTDKEYFHDVAREAPEVDVSHILFEPQQKGTAPAIALGLKILKEKHRAKNSDIFFVIPADLSISPVEKFLSNLKEAEKLAAQGHLVTFGVRPTSPETGYGYILAHGSKVEKFVEKPSPEKALEYVRDGHYFWNAGCFTFSLETMEKELKTHAPEIASLHEGDQEEVVKKFEKLTAISLDYAVMEKSKAIAMVPLDLSWTDLGSWDQVYGMLNKDERGNAVQGEVAAFDTDRSLILAGKRLVATIGVSDLMIVETDDVVLVAQREAGQKVKEVVSQLKKRGKESEVERHSTVHRPWGTYTVLEEGKRYKIKRITVLPKAKLSLQLHYHRSEHWVVVTGCAKVTVDNQEILVREGESIFVPKSSTHRVENPGKVTLEIIEVQVGEYLGEDDIVRLEDIYGRLRH